MFFTNSFQAINTLDNAIEASAIALKYSRKAVLGLVWGVTFAAAFCWYFGKSLGQAYYANGGPSVESVAKAVWKGSIELFKTSKTIINLTVKSLTTAKQYAYMYAIDSED